jgi:hypothetical protein
MRWCALLVAAVLWVGAGAAQADEFDGSWWYEEQGVAQVRAEGITGAGVPVAVVGQRISSDLPVLSSARLRVHEPSFCREYPSNYHDLSATDPKNTQMTWAATNMVALIVGNGHGSGGRVSVSGVAPGADVRFYATGVYSGEYHDMCDDPAGATARAIVQAVDDGARIIVLEDPGRIEPDRDAAAAVAYALHEKVILVAPAYPGTTTAWISGLNGVVAVWRSGPDGPWPQERSIDPPSRITVTAPGSMLLLQGGIIKSEGWADTCVMGGEEFAPALVGGMLADVAQKWPEATNHQLVQSLVRNTGRDDHDLVYDDLVGYGAVDLQHMLRTDPTQYENVNPLVVPDDGQELGLTAQDISDAQRPVWVDKGATPRPTSSPTSASPGPSPDLSSGPGSAGVPVWVWLGGAGLVVTGLVAFITYRVRRRTGHQQDQRGTQ